MNSGFLLMLRDKNILVTGTSRGIGRCVVESCARNGANVWAHARRETSEFLHDMQQIAEQYHVNVWPIFFDMTDLSSMHDVVKKIYNQKYPIDVLINNAGIAHGGLFQMTHVSTIRNIFEVNFFTQLELIQLVARFMSRQKSGSIVNVTSIVGLDLHIGNCAYGTSKAALIAATKTLAAEFGPIGIRINAIAPGLTDTDMAKQMEKDAGHAMIEESAMKRLAKVEEVASAIVYLASDQASFINGQVLRVDGGAI